MINSNRDGSMAYILKRIAYFHCPDGLLARSECNCLVFLEPIIEIIVAMGSQLKGDWSLASKLFKRGEE
jgi:hypothetical protein